MCVLCLCLGMTACNEEKVSSDQKQAAQTEKLTSEANAQIGMPDIINFQERKFAKQILELRDKEILTHTYIKNDFKGCLTYLGRSVGYGLPYAVQFTNPNKLAAPTHRDGTQSRTSWRDIPMPQPDPNGLFMPDSLSATWVLLYDEATKKTSPVYVESELTVSPFRIKRAECK